MLTGNPKHQKTNYFIKKGIFSNLSSFYELENRISSLPNPKEKGEAFEVFAEAFFATQRIEQAEVVWPYEKIPCSLVSSLGLDAARDMGVDGIFKTNRGGYNAYQVKFRTGRPSLTWAELSTFMGLSDRVAQRVLFTNCDRIPQAMNERSGFYCIRGTDLGRLEKRDFQTILHWLKSGVVEIKRKTPAPHQKEALDAVLPALKKKRTTAVMACGTGKTMMALWAAERLDCRNVLVLVPSLALVRQTLHEWVQETQWPEFSYLCVCSDPSVNRGVDELIMHQSDLDFPVSTDSDDVKRFLSRKYSGVRVIFSTYQSAQVVADGMDGSRPFDLGIFDEAHKTAGRQGTRFAFALSDDNLPIAMRLFLTATPRHYNPLKKDKEGDALLVYSMDSPEIYGDRSYTLSFAEAAHRSIICNYRVIISAVTSRMVSDELLRRGEVLVEGDIVRAKQVANQVSLQKAVKKIGARRIFSFHTTVASARAFTGPGGEGSTSYLPHFSPFHVNGAMPAASRERILREFREANRAVMSNARCLTEGVDIPAVDMVAFMAPKRSRVDIIQATGRAMRRSPGKDTGYVLVPLFLQQSEDETIDEALERSEFDEVWSVLEAMQEQDEELAEIIRQMREEQGHIKGFDDTRFREKVIILGPTVGLGLLRKSIIAQCIEHLGCTWDERFGQLQAFREKYGHCNVPKEYPENIKLGTWVDVQRSTYKKGLLDGPRKDKLEQLGFIFDPYEASWDKYYQELVNYHEEYGNCLVPQGYSENPDLGTWVSWQRSLNKKNRLREDRLARLNQIGFAWDPHSETWEHFYQALREYKKRESNCRVPLNYPKDVELGRWVNKQRSIFRSGKMSQDRIDRLNDLGFSWDIVDENWIYYFYALKEFKKKYGHLNVPEDYQDAPGLNTWIKKRRHEKNKGKLSEEWVERLISIGFIWGCLDDAWEGYYSQLKEFYWENGHSNVSRWSNNPELGGWANRQRDKYKKGTLEEEKVERLNRIGFTWDPFEEAWELKYQELVAYYRKFGNFAVPRNPNYNALANWIQAQRSAYRKAKLPSDRIARLEGIGFSWNPYEVAWEQNYEELIKYKKIHGGTNVPARCSENAELGNWVSTQRGLRKKGKLSKKRKELLDSIGFSW